MSIVWASATASRGGISTPVSETNKRPKATYYASSWATVVDRSLH
jgi:hypothetical protein